MRLNSLLSFPCLLILTSCSLLQSSTEQSSTPALNNFVSAELFMAHASNEINEFEHVKLSTKHLFYECGALASGRQLPKEQEFASALEPTQELLAAINAVTSTPAEQLHQLAGPGKAQGFFDSGQFFLTVERKELTPLEIRTSLNTVTQESGSLEKNLRQVGEELRRAIGKSPCGNRSFYGMRGLQ